eukprot:1589920-Pyramimonas_sp.AAC.1
MVAPPRHFGCAYFLVATGISNATGFESIGSGSSSEWLPFRLPFFSCCLVAPRVVSGRFSTRLAS